MDFSPWLHFDDDSDEPMDIEESVPTVDSTGASAPGTQTTSHIVDPTLVSAPNTTNNSLVISGMPEMSTAPQSAGGIKTLIEDSLEQMHTRLVEDGDLDSILGKAFTCIFDYQPDLGGAVQTNFNTTDGDDSVTRFFEIICGKFKLLSSVFTSHSVKGRVGLNLLRVCCEWVLFDTLCFSCLGIVAQRRWLAPPAQELYYVSREGVESLQPLPRNGAKPWKSLRKSDLAPLESWTLRRGSIVNVDAGNSTSPAKVSDIRCLDDGRYVVVYTWLYTREQIIEELEVDGKLSLRDRAHLDRMWPLGDRYRYMLSTNRTITLWDTAIGQAPEEVTSSLCYSAIYSTTPTSRRIWNVENPRYKWMKRILLYEPQTEDLPE